ncbi:MAG: hypothetical protein M5R36_08415 [Deltaproteobacteria bacterium]|nr:hypothetical protein [Deltaproteobacteria bacterium]
MKKATFILIGAMVILALALAVGCDTNSSNDDDDDNQPTDQSSSLEQDLLSIVDDMRSEVTQYADASDKSVARNDYHGRMDQGIGDLSNLWDQMRSQCDQFSDDCPMNGGATGDWSDQCMSGGHMMDQGRMGQLRDFIDSCRSSLDDFWTACGDHWDESCGQMAGQHTQQMDGFLGQMWNDCNDWWSDGGMMNGDHDHWGIAATTTTTTT